MIIFWFILANFLTFENGKFLPLPNLRKLNNYIQISIITKKFDLIQILRKNLITLGESFALFATLLRNVLVSLISKHPV